MIRQGDVMEQLAKLAVESVHSVVTSPPYWGLRDYGVEGQIGLEPTIEEYVAKMVEVFAEVKRVLRKDGTLWLNLGDAYAGSNKGINADGSISGGKKQITNKGTVHGNLQKTVAQPGLKPKDLCGIPWRVAFALQAPDYECKGCGETAHSMQWKVLLSKQFLPAPCEPLPRSIFSQVVFLRCKLIA